MKAVSSFHRKAALLICAIVLLSLLAWPMSVHAESAVSEFDFSLVDDLNRYDAYEKEEDDNGEYVRAALLNTINTLNDLGPDYYRYGAFLRNNEETQRYMFYNLNVNYAITANVLTIYADPEVEFFLYNTDDHVVATESGALHDEVVKFNTSYEGNKVVYFIQLEPSQINASKHMLVFYTSDDMVQPHYSFWFGNPLTRTGTVSGNAFQLSVSYKNRKSASVSVAGPSSVPEMSWVTKVTVTKMGEINAAKVSGVNIGATAPSGDVAPSALLKSSNSFDFYAHSAAASPVRGTYKFALSGVNWKTGSTYGNTYTYLGRMTVEYLYAFGA